MTQTPTQLLAAVEHARQAAWYRALEATDLFDEGRGPGFAYQLITGSDDYRSLSTAGHPVRLLEKLLGDLYGLNLLNGLNPHSLTLLRSALAEPVTDELLGALYGPDWAAVDQVLEDLPSLCVTQVGALARAHRRAPAVASAAAGRARAAAGPEGYVANVGYFGLEWDADSLGYDAFHDAGWAATWALEALSARSCLGRGEYRQADYDLLTRPLVEVLGRPLHPDDTPLPDGPAAPSHDGERPLAVVVPLRR